MISLFQFQEEASARISSRISDYLSSPAHMTVKRKDHLVPFFQALSALTGAGKTVILAEAVSQIADTMPVKPLIMWLSRGKVVVEQSFANLSPGGRYHHLLDNMIVRPLADYSPEEVTDADSPIVFFATVGTFNQKDKESGTLRVHKSDVDTMEQSVWEALRLRTDAAGNRRPLMVVYDEAQNLSDQQTELLLELEPDGFLLASATMKLPARIGTEVQHLKTAGYDDADLVTKIATPDVVSEGLVKDTVLLQGYNAPMEETISQLLTDMQQATEEAEASGVSFRPKAIYVSNTNVVADTPHQVDSPKQPFLQRQAPPILIWRYLVEQHGVDPSMIAVYADLKTDKNFPLPDEFVLFRGGDKDYAEFTAGDYRHVIFNLTLQEGWDDPSVYFAYIDKSMESKAQITQVIGRVLRQPEARHYSAERLNSAHFYVRVDRNAVFNDVIAEVKKELGDSPGGVRIVVSAPGKARPEAYAPKGKYYVPETGLDPSAAQLQIAKILENFADYRNDLTNTKGVGSRRVLRQKVGQVGTETEWEAFEQASQASARWVFHREIQRQYKYALGVVNLADPKLDALVGIGSSAHKQVVRLAEDVVSSYIKGVRLKQRKSNPRRVGSLLAQPDEIISFENAVHEGYAGLNGIERAFAESIDRTGLLWSRNPARSGYGIPLISVGPTDNFYPDFLVWTEERVVCVDTKGGHLVRETAARKLLLIGGASLSPRLDVQFVSEGKYGQDLQHEGPDGYSRWGLADDGSIRTVHFESMDELVEALTDDAIYL